MNRFEKRLNKPFTNKTFQTITQKMCKKLFIEMKTHKNIKET